MNDDFPMLIGKFIHHCGALEFLTNNIIVALSTDSLLASKLIKSPFVRRISLLRQLLGERSNIDKNEINTVCDELDEIRIQRNIVAHNPIFYNEANKTGAILVIRYKPNGAHIPDKLTKNEIAVLVDQTAKLTKKISTLIPESTSTN